MPTVWRGSEREGEFGLRLAVFNRFFIRSKKSGYFAVQEQPPPDAQPHLHESFPQGVAAWAFLQQSDFLQQSAFLHLQSDFSQHLQPSSHFPPAQHWQSLHPQSAQQEHFFDFLQQASLPFSHLQSAHWQDGPQGHAITSGALAGEPVGATRLDINNRNAYIVILRIKET
jgi:hypothetical protein